MTKDEYAEKLQAIWDELQEIKNGMDRDGLITWKGDGEPVNRWENMTDATSAVGIVIYSLLHEGR